MGEKNKGATPFEDFLGDSFWEKGPGKRLDGKMEDGKMDERRG